jgi:cardiolipin synthase
VPKPAHKLARYAATTFAVALLAITGCGGHSPAKAGLARAQAYAPRLGANAVESGPLTLLTMPEDGLPPVLAALRAAKRSIKLKIYMLTDHDESAQLVQALVERCKSGLDVEVVLEVRPHLPASAPSCRTNLPSINGQAIATLQAGGVHVRYASPRFKFTHEKSLVIDDEVAWIMTCNFTNSAFTGNREYIVIDRVPSDVAELLRVFHADWDSTPFTPAEGPLVLSPDNSRQRLLGLIDSATKTLSIQVEYLTDPEVVQHLSGRARAGVDVKVMLAFLAPGACPGDGDTNSVETKLLGEAGVTQVEFVKTLKMHAKCLIADGVRAFVGSENLTTTSLDRNREVGIMLNDPVLVGKLAQMAAIDWVMPAPMPNSAAPYVAPVTSASPAVTPVVSP